MTEIVQIADDLPFPVLMFSDDLILSWVNHAGQIWLGKSGKSLDGKSLSDMFTDDGALMALLGKFRSYGNTVNSHDMVVRPRGRDEEKCDVSAFAHEGAIGICFRPQGLQTQKEDVFDAGASALGRLLAHEVKNPLAGIQGAAQLLRDDVHTEEGLSLLDLIAAEIDRISRLADRMERLGDAPPSELTTVNVHEVLRHARKVIQSGLPGDIVFKENYDPSLPMITGHEDSLTQALMNLIKNASEALLGGKGLKQIALETSYRSGGALPIEIRIIDNGAGIPEHLRDKIFHPFITDKPKGQGLGLALVSKVIAAHDGLIEVRSRPGETIFSILLPITEGLKS